MFSLNNHVYMNNIYLGLSVTVSPKTVWWSSTSVLAKLIAMASNTLAVRLTQFTLFTHSHTTGQFSHAVKKQIYN